MSNLSSPVDPKDDVTDSENSIELKDIAGLSQGQIVRKRFFRHRGALVSMFALAFIIVLAFTSVGVAFGDWKSGGWWQFTWNLAGDIENGGRPTLSLFPLAIGNH
ncbi:MAG: ABC transporter permease, partial [Rhodoglobus sp.]|nr:ABC transporter permease [Rhodoglobus sp.]